MIRLAVSPVLVVGVFTLVRDRRPFDLGLCLRPAICGRNGRTSSRRVALQSAVHGQRVEQPAQRCTEEADT